MPTSARADRVVRPYGVRVHRNLTVRADGSVGPVGRFGFAEDFSKTGASCRVDVGIDPYNAYRRCIKNSELLQVPREKSRKTEAVFPVALRRSGGKSKSPRARFLFVTFSFGEAKEKVRPHPRICRRLSALCRLTTHPAGQDIYIRFPRYAPCGPVNYRPAADRKSESCAPCPPA